MAQASDGDVGLKVVIAYKNIKGGLELTAGLVLAYFVVRGEVLGVSAWAHALRAHVTHRATIELAKLLLKVTTPRFLRLTTLALLMDGLLSFGEGYALHKRWWWGPWLVVGATGALVPFEVMELIRHVRVGRVVFLLINTAVVAYLVRRKLREAPSQGVAP